MSALTTTRNVRIVRPRLSVRAFLTVLLDIDARYRARVQLENLDDHMLDDMGLTRADVAFEIKQPLF